MPANDAASRTEPLNSQKETAHLSDTQPFYGWWIIAAGTVILFVSSGIGFYGHGVILDPLRTMHGWSKATISSAITLYFLTSGIMGMIVGRQVDRYGPKWVLILGSVVICAGFLFLGFIKTVWQLYLLYFIMALGFSCTSLVPVNTLITNWFILKRGFAMSLANTGLSAGGIVLVPFASYNFSLGIEDRTACSWCHLRCCGYFCDSFHQAASLRSQSIPGW